MATEAGSKGRDESSVSFGHPWWRGMRDTTVPVQEPINGFSLQMTHPHSDVENAQEQQGLKLASSSMQEHIAKPSGSQMGPIGNSVVLTAHPFQDPAYGGFMTCAEQVNPGELYGVHQSRMALPLALEEEPVYVNAKQYHGILRRRQIRARAELERKVIKNRKPYLHESRHKHALRRARGAGGRFLNTKELKESKDNSEEDNSNSKYDGHPSDSTLSSNYSGNAWWKEPEAKELTVSEQHRDVLGLSSTYHSRSSAIDGHDRDVLGLSSTYHSRSSASNDGRDRDRGGGGGGRMKMNGFVSVK